MQVSLCVLVYGDYPNLVERLCRSIEADRRIVQDVRIGLHQVSPASRRILEEWTRCLVQKGIWVGWYEPEGNLLKYPTMRRMLADPVCSIADAVAWLDDDTYFSRDASWTLRRGCELLDQHWLIGQYRWFSRVRGYDRFLKDAFGWEGNPFCSEDKIQFCIGGWWMGRRDLVLCYGYPPAILRHKGGDWLLSAMCRCFGLSIGHYDEGVVINADPSGRPNIRWRRGLSRTDPQLGEGHYDGRVYSDDHQHFLTKVTWYEASGIAEEYSLGWERVRPY